MTDAQFKVMLLDLFMALGGKAHMFEEWLETRDSDQDAWTYLIWVTKGLRNGELVGQ